jgi:hypothetical protein
MQPTNVFWNTVYNTNICVLDVCLCVVTSCSLVEIYQRFGGTYCLHHQGIEMMMKAVGTSETSRICTRLYIATTYKTVMSILAAVWTWRLITSVALHFSTYCLDAFCKRTSGQRVTDSTMAFLPGKSRSKPKRMFQLFHLLFIICFLCSCEYNFRHPVPVRISPLSNYCMKQKGKYCLSFLFHFCSPRFIRQFSRELTFEAVCV